MCVSWAEALFVFAFWVRLLWRLLRLFYFSRGAFVAEGDVFSSDWSRDFFLFNFMQIVAGLGVSGLAELFTDINGHYCFNKENFVSLKYH